MFQQVNQQHTHQISTPSVNRLGHQLARPVIFILMLCGRIARTIGRNVLLGFSVFIDGMEQDGHPRQNF